MPVNPRGNRFEATVNSKKLPNGRLRRLFPTQQKAEEWEELIKAKLKAGEPITEEERGGTGKASGPATLAELADLVIAAHWEHKKGCRTTIGNARQCVSILGENLSLASLNLERIDSVIYEFRKRGNSETTINRKMTALRVMINYAVDRDWLPKTIKIPHNRETNGRIRYLSEDEERALLAYFEAISQPDMIDMCIIAIDTGFRAGEFIYLEKRDVDQGMLSVWETKNGHARSVPMTDRVKAVVERRLKEVEGPRLFPDWSHPKLRHRWDQARNHLGLMQDKQFVPHVMRHTFCSRLVQLGVDIATVSKLAGHSTLQMTMRYAHLAPKNLSDAIAKLNPKEDQKRDAA